MTIRKTKGRFFAYTTSVNFTRINVSNKLPKEMFQGHVRELQTSRSTPPSVTYQRVISLATLHMGIPYLGSKPLASGFWSDEWNTLASNPGGTPS
ncbi:cystathionine gamma-synthase [Moniliophthora roreri]|nr:cystathionine gamma-synthase [Moniliophthora roreri]